MYKYLAIILLFLGVQAPARAVLLDDTSILPGSEAIESALDAGRIMLDMISENIANQYTTKDGDQAYKCKMAALESTVDSNGKPVVRVAQIMQDTTEGVKLYDPAHPHADEKGFVEQSNVNLSSEMVNMIKVSRWMEAQYAVANASAKMVENALALGR